MLLESPGSRKIRPEIQRSRARARSQFGEIGPSHHRFICPSAHRATESSCEPFMSDHPITRFFAFTPWTRSPCSSLSSLLTPQSRLLTPFFSLTSRLRFDYRVTILFSTNRPDRSFWIFSCPLFSITHPDRPAFLTSLRGRLCPGSDRWVCMKPWNDPGVRKSISCQGAKKCQPLFMATLRATNGGFLRHARGFLFMYGVSPCPP